MMTLEEAKEYVDRTDFCGSCSQDCPPRECYGCPYSDFISLSKKLIKSQLKYRWHDLRKNPDDLPKDGRLVEIVYLLKGCPDNPAYYGYGHWCGSSKNFNNRTDANIIAWREVEPFKVEEQHD